MVRLDESTASDTHQIIGCAIEVQREFGTGLLESAYGDGLEMEFQDRGIVYLREACVPLYYKGRRTRTTYRADFLCHGHMILEIKASTGLGAADQAQMWHYLAATRKNVGLLLNFARAPLQIRRFVHGRMETISEDSEDSVDSVAGGGASEFA